MAEQAPACALSGMWVDFYTLHHLIGVGLAARGGWWPPPPPPLPPQDQQGPRPRKDWENHITAENVDGKDGHNEYVDGSLEILRRLEGIERRMRSFESKLDFLLDDMGALDDEAEEEEECRECRRKGVSLPARAHKLAFQHEGHQMLMKVMLAATSRSCQGGKAPSHKQLLRSAATSHSQVTAANRWRHMALQGMQSLLSTEWPMHPPPSADLMLTSCIAQHVMRPPKASVVQVTADRYRIT